LISHDKVAFENWMIIFLPSLPVYLPQSKGMSLQFFSYCFPLMFSFSICASEDVMVQAVVVMLADSYIMPFLFVSV
jgi:hypothetical protein